MAVATTKEETVVEQSKQVDLTIQEVEDFAIIVNVQGWRMRVYFEEGFNPEQLRFGQLITVDYFGDIEDPFSIRFVKLK